MSGENVGRYRPKAGSGESRTKDSKLVWGILGAIGVVALVYGGSVVLDGLSRTEGLSKVSYNAFKAH